MSKVEAAVCRCATRNAVDAVRTQKSPFSTSHRMSSELQLSAYSYRRFYPTEMVNSIKWVQMGEEDIVICHVFALKVLAMF